MTWAGSDMDGLSNVCSGSMDFCICTGCDGSILPVSVLGPLVYNEHRKTVTGCWSSSSCLNRLQHFYQARSGNAPTNR
jgi:hypothetical protein